MSYYTPQKSAQHINNYSPDATSTSCEDTDEGFEFDVQPKRKYFETIQEKRLYIEEYTKKKKTELCKNYTLVGYCKYGSEVITYQYSQCSFAHGQSELQPKIHLHQKYKTKPCKRLFKEGYCPYGIRCQYIHGELKDICKPEFERYLLEVSKELGLPQPTPLKQLKDNQRYDLQRFRLALNKQRGDIGKDVFQFHSSRLGTFKSLSQRLTIQEE